MEDIQTGEANTLIEQKRLELEERNIQSKNLLLRNILNGTFIVLALITIIGILVFPSGSSLLFICYCIGIFAVLLKMVEVMMRMPGMRKQLPKTYKRKTNFNA